MRLNITNFKMRLNTVNFRWGWNLVNFRMRLMLFYINFRMRLMPFYINSIMRLKYYFRIRHLEASLNSKWGLTLLTSGEDKMLRKKIFFFYISWNACYPPYINSYTRKPDSYIHGTKSPKNYKSWTNLLTCIRYSGYSIHKSSKIYVQSI